MDYYSDNEPFACQWMCELIADGQIPKGVIDDRSIQDIQPADLTGYRQCHFFAGIGGWAYALQLAGWPADRPVWTGSCPCQPFSVAGKRKGKEDERHLWPVFLRLIRECRPATLFGEQVASDDGYRWLAGVRDDLEEAGYAVGAADLPACSQGAPIIRQRLWFVATTGRAGLRHQRQPMDGETGGNQGEGHQRERLRADAGDGGTTGVVAESRRIAPRQLQRPAEDSGASNKPSKRRTKTNGKPGRRGEPCSVERADHERRQAGAGAGGRPEPFWSSYEVVPCLDGRSRRIEPGSQPLAHGVSGRVGRLRGYGNAISPQTAAAFIRAFLDATDGG